MRRTLVRALRARGVDVITALDAGLIERSDEVHLEYATAQGRVVYSSNVSDFHRLHTAFLAQRRSHAGIILARQQRYSTGEKTRRLLKLIASRPAEAMRNRVEFLGAWG